MSVAPPSRFLQFNKATVQDKLQDDEKLSKLTGFLEQRNAQVLKLKRSGEKQLPNQLVQERKEKCVALPVDSHDRGSTVPYNQHDELIKSLKTEFTVRLSAMHAAKESAEDRAKAADDQLRVLKAEFQKMLVQENVAQKYSLQNNSNQNTLKSEPDFDRNTENLKTEIIKLNGILDSRKNSILEITKKLKFVLEENARCKAALDQQISVTSEFKTENAVLKKKNIEFQAKFTASPSDDLMNIVTGLRDEHIEKDVIISGLNGKILELRGKLTEQAKIEYKNVLKSQKVNNDEKTSVENGAKSEKGKNGPEMGRKSKRQQTSELTDEVSKLNTKCEIMKNHNSRLHILSEKRHKEIDKLKHKLVAVNRELGDLKKIEQRYTTNELKMQVPTDSSPEARQDVPETSSEARIRWEEKKRYESQIGKMKSKLKSVSDLETELKKAKALVEKLKKATPDSSKNKKTKPTKSETVYIDRELAQQQNDDKKEKSELELKDSTIKILSKRLQIVDPDFDQSVAYQYSDCFTVGLEMTALNSEINRLKGANDHLNKMNKALVLDVGNLTDKCEVKLKSDQLEKAGTVSKKFKNKIEKPKRVKTGILENVVEKIQLENPANHEKVAKNSPTQIRPNGDEGIENLQQEFDDLKVIYKSAVKKNLRYEEQLMTIGKQNSDVTVQLYHE